MVLIPNSAGYLLEEERFLIILDVIEQSQKAKSLNVRLVAIRLASNLSYYPPENVKIGNRFIKILLKYMKFLDTSVMKRAGEQDKKKYKEMAQKLALTLYRIIKYKRKFQTITSRSCNFGPILKKIANF